MEQAARQHDSDDAVLPILQRMSEDAERLCAINDTMLDGQAVQLRGRIAAMIAIHRPVHRWLDGQAS